MEKIKETIDNRTFKEKIDNLGWKFSLWRDKQKRKVSEFYHKHYIEIWILAPIVVPGIIGATAKIISSATKTKELHELKDLMIYDRSHGHYYTLKREPSNKEWAEIDRRKDDGESIRIILEDMRLLK